MDKIDNLDKKILNIIMQNARIPSKDVAVQCGVSRAAIHQRIQRLIDMKVITESGYTVNPKSLGFNTCTYVGVRLEKGSMYREVVKEFDKIPEVVECHFTTECLLHAHQGLRSRQPASHGAAQRPYPAYSGRNGDRNAYLS